MSAKQCSYPLLEGFLPYISSWFLLERCAVFISSCPFSLIWKLCKIFFLGLFHYDALCATVIFFVVLFPFSCYMLHIAHHLIVWLEGQWELPFLNFTIMERSCSRCSEWRSRTTTTGFPKGKSDTQCQGCDIPQNGYFQCWCSIFWCQWFAGPCKNQYIHGNLSTNLNEALIFFTFFEVLPKNHLFGTEISFSTFWFGK